MDLPDDKYASCCAQENGGCGPYLRYRTPVDELFEVSALAKDKKPHIIKLKLMSI